MAEPLRWATALVATAASLCLVGQWSQPIAEPSDQAPVVVEDRLEPTDFSPEELKLLQRRNEPTVLEAIRRCISLDALPGVAETALQALSCIGSLDSCQHSIALRSQLAGTRLEEALERQLKAQVRPRAWIEQMLGN